MNRLVLAAHGTRSAAGRESVERIRDALAERLAHEYDVELAWVDVVEPRLADVARSGDTVLPCFLGEGYHVRTDIPAAVAAVPRVQVTEHLGWTGAVEALDSRVRQAGGPWPLTIVGWAGSSDELSRAQGHTLTRVLAERWRGCGDEVRVVLATPDQARELLDEHDGRAGVATYLLAPGHFATKLAGLGVPASEPLGAHEAVIDALVARVRQAERQGVPGPS